MKLFSLALALVMTFFGVQAEARERVSIDQALNKSVKEAQSVQKTARKRAVERHGMARRPKAEALDIEIGDSGGGIGGGVAGPSRDQSPEESLAWRKPDSIQADAESFDAEVSTVNSAKIEISPEEQAQAEAELEAAAALAIEPSKVVKNSP